MAKPGGAIHPFCEPETATSIPHSSTGQGIEPMLLTPSTTRVRSNSPLMTAARAPRSLVTPVEVSLWVTKTTSASGSAARTSRTLAGSAARPCSKRATATSAP